jgi:putative addiction module component (TIGR02574 family)
MVKLDMDVIRRMSVADRLAMVEQIWATIADDPSSLHLTGTQITESLRRLAAHDADPSTSIAWSEAEVRLRADR